MAKVKSTEGPMTVRLDVLNDGTVALVFPRAVERFVASAEEMTQLGTNLIKAATVALMQHGQMANVPGVPAGRM